MDKDTVSLKNKKIPVTLLDMTKMLHDSIDAIQINVDAYLTGRKAGWLAVGSQIYVLLCDPNPKSSLLGKLIPSIKFYPVTTQIDRPKNKDDVTWILHSPAPVHFDEGNISVELFNTSKPKLPMIKWLKQVIGVHNFEDKGHYVTIENLIHYARNQMGPGHFDTEWDEISKSLSSPTIRAGGVNCPFYEWAIILIAHVVVSEIKLELNLP